VNADRFTVQVAPWEQNKEVLRAIRLEVFVQEQQVSESDEWDEHDATAIHFLATEASTGQAAGTARLLLSKGKITRMAVRRPFRRLAVGSMLMEAVLHHAAACDVKELYLDAQTNAVGFYKKFGFEPEGQPFWDAGILHIRMRKQTGESQ